MSVAKVRHILYSVFNNAAARVWKWKKKKR